MDASAVPATLPAVVKSRRIELGLTQLDVAEAMDMTQEWVSRLERNLIELPRKKTMRRLADVLQVEVVDLYVAAKVAKTKTDAQRIMESLPEDDDNELAQAVNERISRNEARQRLTRLVDDLDNRELIQLVTLASLMKSNRGIVQTYELRLGPREGTKITLAPPGDDEMTDEEPLRASGR